MTKVSRTLVTCLFEGPDELIEALKWVRQMPRLSLVDEPFGLEVTDGFMTSGKVELIMSANKTEADFLIRISPHPQA